MSRKKAREEFFKLMFESEIKEIPTAQLVSKFISNHPEELDEDELEFLKSYSERLSKNVEYIDDLIQKNMKNWKLERLGTVERVLLRLAVYEITQEKGVNYRISINEAIELAKLYGEEKSYEFINGVLANVVVTLGIS